MMRGGFRRAHAAAHFCMDTNMVRADFGSGLISHRAQTNSEWFMRAPRAAYPGAQTCCASPTRTPARLANSRRTWSRRRTRKSKCVSSRWKVLSDEFRRRPTALAIKFRKLDRVGRRGLSEPGGIFSRLLTYAFPWLYPRLYPWLSPRLHPWIQPQHPHHIQLETSLRIFSRLNQMIIKTAPAIAHRNPKPMLNKPISCVADWDIAGVEAPLFSIAAI